MLIDPDCMISISEANQNFSKVARLVDRKEKVIIMKHNKPKYIIQDYEIYLESSRGGKNKDCFPTK